MFARNVKDLSSIDNLERLSRKLKQDINKLKYNNVFTLEELELIARVFDNLYPDKIKSISDKEIAKNLLEKIGWMKD